MSFQMLPIALRKNTGSPLSKLLLIYLTEQAKLQPPELIGGWLGGSSDTLEFRAKEAACFCQCTEHEVYFALGELERLGLVLPCEFWLARSDMFTDPLDRWDFLRVSLPVSDLNAEQRKRIKCGEDQIDYMLVRQRYRCATCGKHDDDVQSWHVDHIIPRSVGGADVEENCQAICATCNSRKGAKVHWVDFLGGRR